MSRQILENNAVIHSLLVNRGAPKHGRISARTYSVVNLGNLSRKRRIAVVISAYGKVAALNASVNQREQNSLFNLFIVHPHKWIIVVFIAVGTDFENIVDMISHVRLKISRKQQSISVRHQLARTSEDRLAAVIIGSAVRKKYNHLLPPSVVLIFLTLLYRPMLYPHKIVNKPYCS